MSTTRAIATFLALISATVLSCNQEADAPRPEIQASDEVAIVQPAAIIQPRDHELALLPDGCQDFLADPAQLLQLSIAAFQDANPMLAYRYAALVRQLHPASPEARQAFELAAPALSHMYYQTRADPRSPWVSSEPVFLMEWLADIYIESGDEFPAKDVAFLLNNVPKSMRTMFEDYAADHAVLSRWPLRFKMENGLVEYVALRPSN